MVIDLTGRPRPEGGVDPSVAARRREVVVRLLERGVPLRALEALLPGWEEAIAAAVEGDAAS